MVHPLLSQESIDKPLIDGGYSQAEIVAIKEAAEVIYQSRTAKKTPRKKGPFEIWHIVGPAGSGKTTLAKKVMAQPKHSHSVMIDQDEIRDNLGLFQNTLNEGLRNNLDPVAADDAAFKKWNQAAIYIARLCINRAQADGYNIVRAANFNNITTSEIYQSAVVADFHMTTMAMFAPLNVCQASVEQRFRATGRFIQEGFLENSHSKFPVNLAAFFSYSNHVSLYWREKADGPAVLVAEINSKSRLTQHDPSRFSDMLEAIRETDYPIGSRLMAEYANCRPKTRPGNRPNNLTNG